MVSTLQEDLSQSDNHVKELELALRDRENGGSSVVPELTRKVMKLERSLNAKQVFCETLIKENDKLKKLTEEVSNSDKQEKRDYIDGRYHVSISSLICYCLLYLAAEFVSYSCCIHLPCLLQFI